MPPSDSIPLPFPRGSRPDAETAERVYLIKPVSTLRATYQVRLLAYLARQRGQRLILKVPKACRFEPGLTALIAMLPGTIEREELS